MKQLLKCLILSAACIHYSPTATPSQVVSVAYKFFDDKVSRAAGLVPQSYQPSLSTSEQIKLFGLYFTGTRTGEEIINCIIDKLDLDEFMILRLSINGTPIALTSQFSLEELRRALVEVDCNPAENTPNMLKQRRINWLATEISQSVWHRVELQEFVAGNYIDNEGRLRSLKTLREMWASKK